VVVAGDSAGGTLAALVGLTVGQHEPEALPWPLAGERSAVAAWLAFNPAVDLTALAVDGRDVGFGLTPSIAATAFLGCGRLGPTSCASNRITSASPLAHLDAFDRPGYIVVGARDRVVPAAAHGMRLYAALLPVLGDWRVAIDVVDTGPAEVQEHGGFSFGANRTALGLWLADQVLSRVG
jgi:acetyl esterase/lipase